LDEIVSRGAGYEIQDFRVGKRHDDPSYVRFEVHADSHEKLEKILAEIHPHGAVPVHMIDCVVAHADVAGAFPEGFYCTTNYRTEVRLRGEWIEVEDQEMDCGIVIDPEGGAARCVPMIGVQLGDRIVIGRTGIRVFPIDAAGKKHELFEFMTSAVSSEK